MTTRTPSAAPWVDIRLTVAEHAAADLTRAYTGGEVWLVGALAEGLAHQRSDVDLLVVTPGDPPHLTSRQIGDIRVDLRAQSRAAIEQWHQWLSGFAVTRDNLETFREVRSRMPDLTLLRTARRLTADRAAEPATTAEERAVYQRWALADRCEVAASLAEDLIGLAVAGLHLHAAIVWNQLAIVVAQAEAAASGSPLLSDKWLPSLLARRLGVDEPVPLPPAGGGADSERFAVLQVRLADALLRQWPATVEPQPPADHLHGYGWLPQRYADGWFLRLGDDRVPVTDAQILGWRHAAAARHGHP
jgi:hypothetical protein